MPDLPVLAAFVAAALAMQMAPGPDTMLLIGRGVGQGRRVALLCALGFTAAGAIQLPLLALGVGAIFQTSPLAYALLRYAGAAYLIWLGLRILWRAGRPREAMPVAQTTPRAALREGAITNLLNPNVLVFMLAFLPQFADPANGSVALQILVLGALMKCCGLLVNGTVALASGTAGDWLARHPGLVRWQERFTGGVLVALGARLVLDPADAARR